MPRLVRTYGPANGTQMTQEPHRLRGMGDLLAMVAQPIAGAVDAVLGTNIKECSGCARRRKLLNTVMPLGKG